MKILITGGAGFIGSNLAERLLLEGHDVYIIDNLISGSLRNIIDYFSPERVKIADVSFAETYPGFYDGVERIYHLASPASPVFYMKYPIETIKSNVHGSIAVLEISRLTGARVLLASTSEIYGDPECHPQNEYYQGNVNSYGPRACYDESKRCAEAIFYNYRYQYNCPVRIARIFNTYGPKMRSDDGRVVSNFICGILDGRLIKIYGNGEQTRSFCYVDDTVEGLIRLMESNLEEPVNIGNPEERTIRDLYNLIVDIIEKFYKIRSQRICYLEKMQDDPFRRKPDITRAKTILNWEPQVGLLDGLIKTIEYFKEKTCKV